MVDHCIRLDGTSFLRDEREVASPPGPIEGSLGLPVVRLQYRLVEEELEGGGVMLRGVHFDLLHSSEWVKMPAQETTRSEDESSTAR